MTEINLLPEELRKNEVKESETAKKKSKSFTIEMTAPLKEEKSQAVKLPRPSLLSRLFSAKKPSVKPTVELKPSLPDLKETTLTKKFNQEPFHLPETQPDHDSVAVDFTKDLDKDHSIPVEEPKKKGQPAKSASGRSLFSLFRRRPKSEQNKKIQTKTEVVKLVRGEEQKVLNVDLIPTELSRYPELELPKKLFSSGVILVVVILLVGAVYLGITWYQLKMNNELNQLTNEISQLEKQIAESESQKTVAVTLQKKLELIRLLLDNHIYWTKFFGLLEKYTINEVYYTNFSMAGTDKLVLSAVGKDYESVAKQLVAFQKASDFVQEVKIDAASANLADDGQYAYVTFNINLVLLPTVFREPLK